MFQIKKQGQIANLRTRTTLKDGNAFYKNIYLQSNMETII